MKELIREALSHYTPNELRAPESVGAAAAVSVLLYDNDGEVHVVFQKRTDHVRDHKGQISFPGGAADEGDTDLRYTALRETHEEIGVLPADVDASVTDELLTISNFRVKPFVGWLSRFPYEWKFSDHEVAYLLEHLADTERHIQRRSYLTGAHSTAAKSCFSRTSLARHLYLGRNRADAVEFPRCVPFDTWLRGESRALPSLAEQ